MINSKISICLLEAYSNANYRVFAKPPFTLKINQPSKSLKKLFDKQKENTAAFISPCNPFGILSSHAENLVMESILINLLKRKSKIYFKGVGEDPLKKWPEEQSVFIVNISQDDAITIGRQFKQNAIVWIGPDARPKLIPLR